MLKHILKLIVVLVLVLAMFFGLLAPVKIAQAQTATEIEVNSTGDGGKDGTADPSKCETSGGNGICTLRAAIQTANSLQSILFGTIIKFRITSGLVININSALPRLNVAKTTIQGPNLNLGTDIIINGQAGAYPGIEIRANECAIKNLTISNFGGYGILVTGTQETPVTATVISGNKIGDFNPLTLYADPNYGGIKLVNVGSSVIGGNTIAERNIISGNTWSGIRMEGGGPNLIKGNYIGVKENGTSALANNNGISIDASNFNTIGGNTVGERNIISGNTLRGIEIYGSSNDVMGNFIGTDSSGTLAIPNGEDGVRVGKTGSTSNNNQIGGVSAGQGNLISGNLGKGIAVYLCDSTDIFGNTIGLNAAQTAALPNNFGITLDGCTNTEIGRTDPGATNVIAGNTRQGIFLGGTDTENTYIKGNYIGLNSSGASFPNLMDGITIQYGGFAVIGGTETGARNVIANNGDNGIELDSAYAKIETNSIYNNAKLGIDVFTRTDQRGITPNDFSEADNVQNFPGITNVSSPNAGSVLLQGQMTTTPSEQLTVYFYGNDLCNPSGYGEGQLYLGLLQKSANASGQLSFSIEVPNPEAKTIFTASVWGPTHGNSEFSPCRSEGIFPPIMLNIYLPAIMK